MSPGADDKGDRPQPIQLADHSDMTSILNKNLEKKSRMLETASEGKDTEINPCWKESGARE